MKGPSDNYGVSTDLLLMSLAVIAVVGAGIALSATGSVPGTAVGLSTPDGSSDVNTSGTTTAARVPGIDTKDQYIIGTLNTAKLESDLEMEVVNITSRRRTVIVRHTLAEGFTREESIGIMLGVFENTWNLTRENGEEWRVQRIEGEIVGPAGDTVAEYHVRRVWLEDLYRGRISRYTFSEQVMETLSETDVS